MLSKYILAPYVRLGFEADVLCLGFGSIQRKIKGFPLQKLIIRAAHYWKTPRTLDEVFIYLKSLLPQEEQTVDQAVKMLLESHCLIKDGNYDKNERYSRHHLFYALSGADPVTVQKKLQQKHVAIVGCGGIGNLISVSLATAGIRKLTLIDDDHIELSNLTRQILFTEEDLNQNKGLILQRELLKRASNVTIEVINKRLNIKDTFQTIPQCDLIVLSADSPHLVYKINQLSIDRRLPFINVGYIQDIAVWGPFVIPGKTGCYVCQKIVASFKSFDENLTCLIREINGNYQAPSIGPVNMLAASHAALDIIKYLGGFGQIHSLNKRVGIWTHNLQIETQNCKRNINCDVCGKFDFQNEMKEKGEHLSYV